MKKKNFLICASVALAVAGIGAVAWFNRGRLEKKFDELLEQIVEFPCDEDDVW